MPPPPEEEFDVDALIAEEEQFHADRREPSPSPPPVKAAPARPTFTHLQSPKDYLPALNEAQRRAVEFPANASVQILAGPGSVVTFTNKSANEMKVRLTALVGAQCVEKIMMGTFHSVCVRLLRKHPRLAGLKSNFLIASRDDALGVLKRLLATPNRFTKVQNSSQVVKEFKPNFVMDVISKCKSTGLTVEGYRILNEAKDGWEREKFDCLADLFEEYEAELTNMNALDFDDLLVRGLDLVRSNPKIMSRVKTVLIDEFQDTNYVQYDLVRAMAKTCRSLTIVGDPDQSIYGWRSADVENLGKMVQDFKPVAQIFLEENYRSTGAILGAALAIVRQDKNRINKSLKATHPAGLSPVVHSVYSAFEEADYIARQIKHIIAHSGNMINYGDFAILLRFQALSRNIEQALQKNGIPSRFVGGNKFFDRKEVKDVLAYLQLVDNPSFTAAFTRVVNVPKRSIGDKTVKDILAAAKLKKISPFEVCVRTVNGSSMAGVTKPQRSGLRLFVTTVLELRKAAEEGVSVPILIDQLLTKTDYVAHLERTYAGESRERAQNIDELKAYAATCALDNPEGLAVTEEEEEDLVSAFDDDDDDIIIEEVAEKIVMPTSSQAGQAAAMNPLRTFLAVSMLATDSETEASKSDATSLKVTLSTCHAAKGLEWPCVFIPACEEGTYPSFRCETEQENDEERRLLYVAITRAQAVCTLTHSQKRMRGAELVDKKRSPFLDVAETYPTLFRPTLSAITAKTRADFAKVLHRSPVPEEEATIIAQHYEANRPAEPSYDSNRGLTQRSYSQGGFSQGSQGVSSQGSYSQDTPSYNSQAPHMSQYGPAASFQRAGATAMLGNTNAFKQPIRAVVPPGAGFSSALSAYKAVGTQPSGFRTASTSGASTNPSFRTASMVSNAAKGPSPAFKAFKPPMAAGSSNTQMTGLVKVNAPIQSTMPLLNQLAAGVSTHAAPSQPAPALPPPSLPSKATATLNNYFAPKASTSRALRTPPAGEADNASTAAPRPAPPPPVSPSRATTSGKGSLKMPETRSSRIAEAVLVNPVYKETPDLLSRFQSAGEKDLEAFGNGGPDKGEAVVSVDLVDTSSDQNEPRDVEEPGAPPSAARSTRTRKASRKATSADPPKKRAKRKT